MVSKPEVLALIPARGGSKGIPRKNIKLFAGYPLIAYSIAAALQSEYVTRVIVSTDDEEIAAVARKWGAETPFLRPAEFAADKSLDLPVFQHALRWLQENEGYKPDVVIQLRPTSPVRQTGMVDEAIRILLDHADADSVRGVVPSGENPHKMWRVDSQSGKMSGLLEVEGIEEPYNAPRQVLPVIYWQTGHIDAIRPERTFMAGDSMSGKNIYPLYLNPDYTVDIDTPFDWMRYEWVVIHSDLDMVYPEKTRRSLPKKPALLAMDFDGVMTDDCVYTDQDGREMVRASRSDGMGIALLKKAGVDAIVISSETNPVVSARCKKLGVTAFQGVGVKTEVLQKYLSDHQIDPKQTVYIGNDVNDIACFPLVQFAVVPADAHEKAKAEADLILTRNGGTGALRELCDIILNQLYK